LWTHREKAGSFVNGLHAAFGLGAFMAPLVVQFIAAGPGNIHWVFWTFAILTIPIGLWVFVNPSPSARTIPEHHRNVPLAVPALGTMVFCFAFYVGAEAGYGNFIKTYTVLLKLGTESQANFLNSAFWGFFTLGRLLGVWLSTRLRPITLLALDLAGCCASLLLILSIPASATILWIGTIILGVSLASIFPSLLALSDERMHVTGTLAGWFLVGGSVGGMSVPWVIGRLSARISAGAMPGITLVCVIATCAALILFIKAPVRALDVQ